MGTKPSLTAEELSTLQLYQDAMYTLRGRYPALRQIRVAMGRWDLPRRLRYFYHIEQLILDEKALPWMIDLQTKAVQLRFTQS